MKATVISIVAVVVVGFAVAADDAPKLHPTPVTVYYRVADARSLDFLREQLIPAWNQLKPWLTIEYKPLCPMHRDTTIADTLSMQCERGDPEKILTMQTLCALEHMDAELQGKFVNCTAQDYNVAENTLPCAERWGNKRRVTEQCVFSELMYKYYNVLNAYLDARNVIPITTVEFPAVLVGQSYRKSLQPKFLTDFYNTIKPIMEDPSLID